jgi:hypothetical protein
MRIIGEDEEDEEDREDKGDGEDGEDWLGFFSSLPFAIS